MDLEQRIELLEDAHLALLAEHTALMEICKILFAFTSIDRVSLGNALLTVYDSNNSNMDKVGFDEDFQKEVRKKLDELSEQICAGADIWLSRKSFPKPSA